MPKCKLDRCNEEAEPYGKRYCLKHKAEYGAKQAAYLRGQNLICHCAPEPCHADLLLQWANSKKENEK